MKNIFLASCIFFLLSCNHKENTTNYISRHYCIVNDSYNNMDLNFYMKSDSVFVYYLNVVDSGNYINGYSDTTDYAGHFTVNDIKDSSITVTLKSYRNEEDNYGVNLKFSNLGKSLSWNIDSSVVAYLPKKAIFQACQ